MTEDREYWNNKMDLNLYKLCSRGKEFVESCGLPYDIICDNAIDFTDKELELIEQYAATRGIKKATAVKELCINHLMILSRGLELSDNNVFNDIYLLLRYVAIPATGILDIKWYLDNNRDAEAISYLENYMNSSDTHELVIDNLKEVISKIKNNLNNKTNLYA